MAQLRLDESLRAVEAEIAAGHSDLALAHCTQLQTQFPRAIAVQRALGEIYLAQRRPREAVAALDRVLQADPDDARTCCLRAAVYQMHGDTPQALAWYARACDARPDDTILRATYHSLAASLGRPPYSPSRRGLARLYLRGGLYTHAIHEWEALIAEQADALDAQVGLAETLWRGSHIQPATDRCLRILANIPTCIKPMLLLAVMHVDAGRLDEAQRMADRAAELDADRSVAWSLFADRFRGGDTTLRRIVLGVAREAQTSPPSASAATVNASRDPRAVSRPLATPIANGTPSPPPSRITASTLRELPVNPTQDPRLRDGIRQTEIMLGRDESSPAASRPAGRASYLSDGPTLLPPVASDGPAFVPPVLAEQGANLEETEVRQGLAWLRWLQQNGVAPAAPGAPPMRGPLTGSGAMPAPLSPPAQGNPAQPGLATGAGAMPAAAVPGAGPSEATTQISQAVSPRRSGPLPEHNSEELRAMFAELGAAGNAASAGRGEASVDALSHASGIQRTLEAIERDYAASGFQQIEPRPGLLADLATQHAGDPPGAPAGDARDRTAASDAAEHGGAGTAEEGAPDADTPPLADPMVRLAEARRRRDAGHLDAALSEYDAALRTLRDREELLPQIIDDLEAEIEAQPTHAGLHQLLGDARIQQGDFERALESYNHAVAFGQDQRG